MTIRQTKPAITVRTANERLAPQPGRRSRPGEQSTPPRPHSPAQRGAVVARGAPPTPPTPATTLADQADAADLAALRATAIALEARRRALGCSLAALARQGGLSATTVARSLRGDVTKLATPRNRQFQRQRLMTLALALDAYAAPATQRAPQRMRSLREATAPTTAPTVAPTVAPPTQATVISPTARSQTPTPTAPTAPTHPNKHVAPTTTEVRRAGVGDRPMASHMGQAALAVATRPPLATYRVLIVEDDPDIVAIYRLALAEATNADDEPTARYAVTVAPTVAGCVAALRAAQVEAQPYDLLLMDLNLRDIHADAPHPTPEPDILAALTCEAAATLPRSRLVVSGMAPYHLRRARQALARLGAAYLPKPFDIETLIAAVYALCAPGARPAPGLAYFT